MIWAIALGGALAAYRPWCKRRFLTGNVLIAFAVGFAVIAWLLRYITSNSYLPFVIYRVVLGLLVMALLAAGVLTTG